MRTTFYEIRGKAIGGECFCYSIADKTWIHDNGCFDHSTSVTSDKSVAEASLVDAASDSDIYNTKIIAWVDDPTEYDDHG